MNKKIIAILFAFIAFFTIGVSPAFATDRPNGRICVDIRANSNANLKPVAVEMSQYKDAGPYFLTDIERGYCTDWYRKTFWIQWFIIDAHHKCTSQWGYEYKPNKVYYWSGNSTSNLTLHCMYYASI